jgi:hypothetical protein
MESIRTVDLQELRARVARAEYVVDTDAVAEAIVRRALRREHRLGQHMPPLDADGPSFHDPAAA